jgi:hypothetical protein
MSREFSFFAQVTLVKFEEKTTKPTSVVVSSLKNKEFNKKVTISKQILPKNNI